jgi:uncharacterized membrane protein YphA (DoxX/SURF4 family)
VSGAPPKDPEWVAAILGWPGVWLLARIGLSSAYLLGGLTKLLDFPAASAEQDHFGFHPGWVWAIVVIAVELGGSILLIWGRWVWLAAGALGVLTFVASLAANNFWALQGPARFAATNAFFEHIGLIAGFVMAALLAEQAQRANRISPSPSA